MFKNRWNCHSIVPLLISLNFKNEKIRQVLRFIYPYYCIKNGIIPTKIISSSVFLDIIPRKSENSPNSIVTSWIKSERPSRVVSMKVSSSMCLCSRTGMWYMRLQQLHHSYVIPSSSAPDHATTLLLQPIGKPPSHAPFEGPMGALSLTHGYLGPITSHTQVLRQECIHTHTPPP